MKTARQKLGAAVCIVCVAASGYMFGNRSKINLSEVRPELQAVATCALNESPFDFVVVDGGRTMAEHKTNVANGKSWVSRSRHQDGAAIDFAALVDNKITYEAGPYRSIAAAFSSCSIKLQTPIVWGGEWKVQDLMHIELDRRFYP